jgi:glyoxylase-like metal-dependent hydrolase (beta-lactamase superfamily II)
VSDTATHRIRVGTIDVLVVKDGTPSTDPVGAFMADVPVELEGTTIEMCGGLLVVDTPDGRFLVDSGNGPHRGVRTFDAESALAAEGIDPGSVDAILLTHGDPDHILGLLTASGDPVYPNASYVLHRDLWDAWHAPPNAGLYFPEQEAFVRRLASVVGDRCTRFDAEVEVFPGVRAVPALGHRAGHTVYSIESEGQTLLHVGDAAVHPIFLEYPRVLDVRHDTEPERASDARRMISARAAAEGAWVVGTHFPLPGIGTLTEIDEDRYTWSTIEDSKGG